MAKKQKQVTLPGAEFFLKYPQPNGIRVIDVAGEREKPVFMSDEEFSKKLSDYTLKDFLYSEEPYYVLVEVSRGQVGLYDQLATDVINTVRALCENEGIKKHFSDGILKQVADKIDFNKCVFILGTEETNSILGFISEVEADADTADKVSVLPLMCGSGKSTAITLKIKEVIERGNGLGMLIVTDSNKRLDELWNENSPNPLLGDDIRAFIKAHKKDVTIMKADTYDKAIRAEKMYPVLAMTTQRFFNVLTKDEIKRFLTWQNEGVRPLILFDEEPYLNEICDLTPKTVNDIDTMLRMVLDDNNVQKEDKQWCIRQWEAFREKFLRLLWEYEYEHEGNMFYYEDRGHALTEDDNRFFDIIGQCKTDIRSDNVDNFKNIHACKALVDSWGLYSHRVAGSYESKFTVFLDNRDKVQGLGAKVIVLDATGDVSPMYQKQDYIDMRDGMNYARSLSRLKIKLVDVDTSKSVIFTRNCIVPQTVTAYLHSEGYNLDNAFIFTYKGREDRFTAFDKRTAHFGGIKGSNDYEAAECIAQVGLNELQPVHYLVHTLARDDELLARLSGLTAEESWQEIQKIMKDTNRCADIKVAHLLADVDQNMFRSAIRTAKNRKDVVFYLFYKRSHLPLLQGAIRNRYCRLLGGKLALVNADTVAAFEPVKDNTTADKIYEWYCNWDGSLKQRKTILKELDDMKPDTFKKTVDRDDRLRPLFSNASEKAKRAGKPRGWFMK